MSAFARLRYAVLHALFKMTEEERRRFNPALRTTAAIEPDRPWPRTPDVRTLPPPRNPSAFSGRAQPPLAAPTWLEQQRLERERQDAIDWHEHQRQARLRAEEEEVAARRRRETIPPDVSVDPPAPERECRIVEADTQREVTFSCPAPEPPPPPPPPPPAPEPSPAPAPSYSYDPPADPPAPSPSPSSDW